MPTLDEYRRWLQGEPIDELPDRNLSNVEPEPELKIKPDPVVHPDDPSVRITAGGGHYVLDPDGTDARLNFGKYKGHTISELAEEKHTITYLEWMMNQDFPEDLMKIVKAYAHPFGPEARELGLVDAEEDDDDGEHEKYDKKYDMDGELEKMIEKDEAEADSKCPRCEGDGEGGIEGSKCPDCDGEGYL